MVIFYHPSTLFETLFDRLRKRFADYASSSSCRMFSAGYQELRLVTVREFSSPVPRRVVPVTVDGNGNIARRHPDDDAFGRRAAGGTVDADAATTPSDEDGRGPAEMSFLDELRARISRYARHDDDDG